MKKFTELGTISTQAGSQESWGDFHLRGRVLVIRAHIPKFTLERKAMAVITMMVEVVPVCTGKIFGMLEILVGYTEVGKRATWNPLNPIFHGIISEVVLAGMKYQAQKLETGNGEEGNVVKRHAMGTTFLVQMDVTGTMFNHLLVLWHTDYNAIV